jgi:hypothetical protein
MLEPERGIAQIRLRHSTMIDETLRTSGRKVWATYSQPGSKGRSSTLLPAQDAAND